MEYKYEKSTMRIVLLLIEFRYKRRIVERTFSWFDTNRRLCRNYELTFDSAEEMVKIASIRLLLNKI
ncbi:hypothetical protein EZS27_032299 [termite gut metagenome]|uniref:Transposase DDE domain-containing protein n=1 Tax=termite gut metagenome TaxID=433724 RepID=A0A5J4Q8J8_9ZZZZ